MNDYSPFKWLKSRAVDDGVFPKVAAINVATTRNSYRLFLTIAFVLSLLVLPGTRLQAQQRTATRSLDDWQQVLKTGELDTRREAAIATRSAHTQLQRQLVPVFIELPMHEKDGQIRLAIFDTVSDMGPAAYETVPALMNAMRSNFGGKFNEQRHQDYRAAIALSSIGVPAVEGLRDLLSDDAENLRCEASMALGRIGPPAAAAIPNLIELLADESARVSHDASVAIGKMGTAAIKPLISAVQSTNANVRAGAVEALGRVGLKLPADDGAIDTLLKALEDEQATVRAAAVKAIASADVQEQTLQTRLLESLSDSDQDVRVAVVNALQQRPKMRQNIQSQLADLLASNDDGVSWHAAFLLQLGGTDNAPILLNALKDKRSRIEQISEALSLIGRPLAAHLMTALDDPDPRVRQGAALTLGQIRPLVTDTVVKLSEGLKDDDGEVQAAYLKSLSALGSRARAAVPAVRAMRTDPRPAIRMQVIDVLFEAAPRDQQLIDELIELVNDSDPKVQQHAIRTIHSMGPFARPAIPTTIEALRSANDGVRNAAAGLIASQGRAAAQAVPQLIKLLEKGDLQWRVTVIQTLGELGATAQPAHVKLSELMTDGDSEIRAAAVSSLASLQLSPEEIGPTLIQALSDSDESVRSQASSGIRRFGRRGVIFIPDLILLVATQQESDSIDRLLERFERYETDSSSISRLIELLENDHPKVRRLAIRFLSLAGPAAKDLPKQLQPFTEDEDESVRDAAIAAIQKIQKDIAETE